MKLPLALLLLASLLAPFASAASAPFDMVRRADRERVDAILANDASRLTTVLSDELTYGGAEGALEGKAAFLTLVATKRLRYSKCEYDEVSLEEAGPGVVRMTGLARIAPASGDGQGAPAEIRVRFLAVWRNEDGHWRLFAYQSTRLPEARAPG